MAEFIKNNPKVFRTCILYEFSDRKPIFESYKELRKRLDNDVDYPEFEFWYMRFAQGKYDLDYDRRFF